MSKFFRLVVLILAFWVPVDAIAEDLDATFAALEARWKDAIEAMNVPGLSVAVVYHDKVVYAKGFGLRDVDSELPFTAETTSYIASSTKPFTAFGIMTLVDQGKVDLDERVQKYLPKFDLPKHDLAKKLTVRDLLCHRYGIDNQIVTMAEAYTGEWDDEFFFREVARSSGIKGSWEYTNLHLTIAGRVIEAVTGKPWQEYLREAIFQPLGMAHTTARASEFYGYDNHAVGLVPKNGQWTESSMRKEDNTMHAAGGIASSAMDLTQWLRLQMSDGEVDGTRLISAASLAEMFKPEVETTDGYMMFDRGEMGLSWHLGGYHGEKLTHHFGGYVGYGAHVSFMPEHMLGVVVLANSDRAGSLLIHQVAADVYDRVLGLPGEDGMPALYERVAQLEKRANERQAAIPPLPDAPLDLTQPIDAYTGAYTSDQWGTLHIERKGDTLVGHLGNLDLMFYAKEQDKFTMVYPMGREVITFIPDKKGRINEVRIATFDVYTLRFTR